MIGKHSFGADRKGLEDRTAAWEAASAALEAWLAELPPDGTDTAASRQLEARIAESLCILDKGDDMDRRHAAVLRELKRRVDQRRAGRRSEN